MRDTARTRITNRTRADIKETLRRIKVAIANKHRRHLMVQRHVAAKVRYGCALVRFTDKVAKEIQIEIEKTVLGSVGMGRSPALCWVLRLGARMSPRFWRDMEPIQTRRRLMRRAAQRRLNNERGVTFMPADGRLKDRNQQSDLQHARG